MDALIRAEKNYSSVVEMNRCSDEIDEESYAKEREERLLNEEDNPFI